MPSRHTVLALFATCTVLAGAAAAGEPPARTAAADTEPPTAPTGLAASDVGCAAVTLSWSAATDDTGVAFYDL
jgi:hypothetical protein